MSSTEFLVDILNSNGQIIDNKPRKDIIKGQDIYHAVYVVVITPSDEIVVSLIPDRQDLPNFHAGKYGCTAATIRCSGETAQQAAERAVSEELCILEKPQLFYEDTLDIDNTRRMVSFYKVKARAPTDFSKQDIDEISTFPCKKFEKVLNERPESFTPLLKLFWQKFYI